MDPFLKFGYIPEPNTIYKNIFKLEKGSLIELNILKDELKFTKKKYFNLIGFLKQQKKLDKDNSSLEQRLTLAIERVHLSDAIKVYFYQVELTPRCYCLFLLKN